MLLEEACSSGKIGKLVFVHKLDVKEDKKLQGHRLDVSGLRLA